MRWIEKDMMKPFQRQRGNVSSCCFMIYTFWAVLQRMAMIGKQNILWWCFSNATECCQALLSKAVQRRGWYPLQPGSASTCVLPPCLNVLWDTLPLFPSVFISSQPYGWFWESGVWLWRAGSLQWQRGLVEGVPALSLQLCGANDFASPVAV